MPNSQKLKDRLFMKLLLPVSFGGILLGLAIEIAVQWLTQTILIMNFLDFILLTFIGIYLVKLTIDRYTIYIERKDYQI
ncbi:MAG: hypothetical protein H3Z53_02500 [archaeon]|nr:hypothetical protein [archaeon]